MTNPFFHCREANLHKIRDAQNIRAKRFKMSPLERGWSGQKMQGRKLGPPDPIGDCTFDGFETIVLESKMVTHMHGQLGRIRQQSAFAVTGNGNGSAGFALNISPQITVALKNARNRAGQKLMTIPIAEGETVFHDFHCRFGLTNIYVSPKAEGYGLRCHRIIKAICEVVGIKNMWAKVEGAKTPQHIAKAFFLGLLQQRSHQQLAEEKGLYLIETRKDHLYYPKILGAPKKCRTDSELRPNEVVDLRQYCYQGRVLATKRKPPNPWRNTKGWEIHEKKEEKKRSHETIKRQMYFEHGELRSFYTEKYPECVPFRRKREETKDGAEGQQESYEQ